MTYEPTFQNLAKAGWKHRGDLRWRRDGALLSVDLYGSGKAELCVNGEKIKGETRSNDVHSALVVLGQQFMPNGMMVDEWLLTRLQ